MSDSLDDLAACAMNQTTDPDTTEADRMSIFFLVGAYHEGDDPPLVAAALRTAASAYTAHPDYRLE